MLKRLIPLKNQVDRNKHDQPDEKYDFNKLRPTAKTALSSQTLTKAH